MVLPTFVGVHLGQSLSVKDCIFSNFGVCSIICHFKIKSVFSNLLSTRLLSRINITKFCTFSLNIIILKFSY